MRHLSSVAAPAALAALAVVVFEILRSAILVEVGGISFGFAVLGLLGLPLFVVGTSLLGVAAATRAGWRFGRGELPAPSPARRVAWVLFGLVAAAVLVVGVQVATVAFVKAFRKPVYQGLGAGLAALGIVGFFALLAGPVVGLLARLLDRVGPRLPRFVNPLRREGAVVLVAGLGVAGLVLAPVLRPELATIDLRPVRLLVVWLAVLLALRWWMGRSQRPLPWLLAGLGFALAAGAALAWSASALGESQSRRLALQRDTLLTGGITQVLGRFGDGDGDGVAGSFGGGDCDDTRADTRPGIVDLPDDGIDQNCTGADQRKSQDPLKVARHATPVGPPTDWHVVVLTVDALRFDAYRAHMPGLQAVAAQAVDFENAYAHGASTYWSVPSLMASTVPSRLDMGRDQTPVAAMTLLAEVLQPAGWHTALFANVTIFFVRGLRQGTDVGNYETSDFTVHGAKPGSAHLTDGLLRHVDAFLAGKATPKKDRLFLWGHYYDPHDPYFEVPGFPAEDGSDKAKYEAIVRYTDQEITRLIKGLQERGLWEKTLFVLTADHGDEFLDHGHRFHGHSLYEEMVHVPLLLHVPGVAPRRIAAPIGHLDVGPTLLDLLNLPVPKGWLGQSRAATLRTGQPWPETPVYFEALPDSNYKAHQVGVRVGNLKLIHRVREHIFELYDLEADPKERSNRVDDHPRAAELKALLGIYLDHHLSWLARGKTGAEVPPGAPK